MPTRTWSRSDAGWATSPRRRTEEQRVSEWLITPHRSGANQRVDFLTGKFAQIDGTLTRIDGQFTRTDHRFDDLTLQIERRFVGLEGRLDAFQAEVDERFRGRSLAISMRSTGGWSGWSRSTKQSPSRCIGSRRR